MIRSALSVMEEAAEVGASVAASQTLQFFDSGPLEAFPPLV